MAQTIATLTDRKSSSSMIAMKKNSETIQDISSNIKPFVSNFNHKTANYDDDVEPRHYISSPIVHVNAQPDLAIKGKSEAEGNIIYVGEDYVLCEIKRNLGNNINIRLPLVLFNFAEIHSGLPFYLLLNEENGFRTPQIRPRIVSQEIDLVDTELSALINSIS